MGTHAESVAIRSGVSRVDQDEFALQSHQRAVADIDAGRFDEEIVPVPVRRGRFEILVTADESPRRDTSADAHAGAVKSAHGQVVIKEEVTLALSGTGRGWDLGVALGNFVISRR